MPQQEGEQERAIAVRIQRAGGPGGNRNLNLAPETRSILGSPEVVRRLALGSGEAFVPGAYGKLLVFILDNSGSMSNLGEQVREGYNRMLDRMQQDRSQLDSVLINTIDLSERVINPVGRLRNAVRLTPEIYDPSDLDKMSSGTPLRDALITASGQTVNEIQRHFAKAKDIQAFIVAITDGEDAGSEHTYEQTRGVITDIRASNNIIYAMWGLGSSEIFEAEAERIGIPPKEFVVASDKGLDHIFGVIGETVSGVNNPNAFRALARRGGIFSPRRVE